MYKSKKKIPQEIKDNAVIVDSNLLLLLLIGHFDKRIIKGFSRLSEYTTEDYDYLSNILENKIVLTTPHILTEISNLSGKLPLKQKEKFFIFLKTILPAMPEHHITSSIIVLNNAFVKFGITDATVIELAKQGIPSLTSDLDLYYYMVGKGYNAFNFFNLRSPYIIK